MFGYDKPWPAKENYDGLLEQVVKGLERLGNKRNSFMIYGSSARRDVDFVPGRSDIDALLVFDYDVVIAKEEFMAVSRILADALIKHPVNLQLTAQDTTTMNDGRLFTFGTSFKEYFKQEGKVLFGPDYREGMNFIEEKPEVTSTLAFNLRKVRQQLLMSTYDIQQQYQIFVKNFGKALGTIADISKKVVYLAKGDLIASRFGSINDLINLYPAINVEPLLKIKHLFHDLEELSALYKGPTDYMVDFWTQALTCYEAVIKEFIHSTNKSL
jgi:hypothetical protein